MNKELNIGDYVRTKYGIEKILELDDINTSDNIFITKIIKIGDGRFITDEEVLKTSPNIIDLIEVGDYVNGMPVLHKENDELVCGLLLRYKEKNIENIVTKEQFEAMKYKIESEVN